MHFLAGAELDDGVASILAKMEEAFFPSMSVEEQIQNLREQSEAALREDASMTSMDVPDTLKVPPLPPPLHPRPTRTLRSWGGYCTLLTCSPCVPPEQILGELGHPSRKDIQCGRAGF